MQVVVYCEFWAPNGVDPTWCQCLWLDFWRRNYTHITPHFEISFVTTLICYKEFISTNLKLIAVFQVKYQSFIQWSRKFGYMCTCNLRAFKIYVRPTYVNCVLAHSIVCVISHCNYSWRKKKQLSYLGLDLTKLTIIVILKEFSQELFAVCLCDRKDILIHKWKMSRIIPFVTFLKPKHVCKLNIFGCKFPFLSWWRSNPSGQSIYFLVTLAVTTECLFVTSRRAVQVKKRAQCNPPSPIGLYLPFELV